MHKVGELNTAQEKAPLSITSIERLCVELCAIGFTRPEFTERVLTSPAVYSSLDRLWEQVDSYVSGRRKSRNKRRFTSDWLCFGDWPALEGLLILVSAAEIIAKSAGFWHHRELVPREQRVEIRLGNDYRLFRFSLSALAQLTGARPLVRDDLGLAPVSVVLEKRVDQQIWRVVHEFGCPQEVVSPKGRVIVARWGDDINAAIEALANGVCQMK